MATIEILDFDLEEEPGNYVKITVVFNLTRTSTERRLDIPFFVRMDLYEEDGPVDYYRMFATQELNQVELGNQDDWGTHIHHGWYRSDGKHTVSNIVHKTQIYESEWGKEEWYIVAWCRPNIYSAVDTSKILAKNLK